VANTPSVRSFGSYSAAASTTLGEMCWACRHAAAREFECAVQRRSIRDRARHLLGENVRAPGFGQRVTLQGKVFVYGRYAGIAEQHRLRRDFAGIGIFALARSSAQRPKSPLRSRG
jgi:hypothetical protein